MQRILAVIAELQDAERLVERTRALAAQLHAKTVLLRPVQAQLGGWQKVLGAANLDQLREEILAVERQSLEAIRGGDRCEVLWCERTYRAVVERAEALGVELIVIKANRHGALEHFIHADDWHLLREAPCPVLVLPRAPKPVSMVLAAVDALADEPDQALLAERVLDQASAFAHAHGLPLTVVTVVPDPALIYASPAMAPLATDLIGDLTERVRVAQQSLLDSIGLKPDAARVETGRVEDVLAQLAVDALLVIGSAANKGLRGLVLGNTAERILHRVTTEMLVVN